MPKNILQATVSIIGTRPLLQHQFGPDALPLEAQERTGVAGNNPEEWKRTRMVDNDGRLYVTSANIFSMLTTAAKNTKKSKGTMQQTVAATLLVDPPVILLTNRVMPAAPTYDKHQEVYIDVQGVVNPNTKSRNVRYRLAAAPGWECSFVIAWDKTIVNREQMLAIVNDASVLVGLGDGRKIGFGRFTVKEFTIHAEVKTAA